MPPAPPAARRLRQPGGACADCGKATDRRAARCPSCAARQRQQRGGNLTSEHQRAAQLARHAKARENARLAGLARAAGLG